MLPKPTAILASTDRGVLLANQLRQELENSVVFSTRPGGPAPTHSIASIAEFLASSLADYEAFIFIGALGICVRSIAPYVQDKATDPAIVNLDDHGQFVQPVLSGHLGGANDLARRLARVLGAQAIITTASDLQDIWALDTLAGQFNWQATPSQPLNQLISLFVNNAKTALLLDVQDEGTRWLEKTRPDFVDVFYDQAAIDWSQYQLLLAVTYRPVVAPLPTLVFYAPVLHLGLGCSRDIEADLLEASVRTQLAEHQLAPEAVKSVNSIDIKHDEVAFIALAERLGVPLLTYPADVLNAQTTPNPSDVVLSKLGVPSVGEAAAQVASGNGRLLLEKQKTTVASGKKHTLAVALAATAERRGVVAIVGAGPGDASLISVKGKELLEAADLILYAGSLVPERLTHYAKPGAVVRNSASMTLEDQLHLMSEHYQRGHLTVRLHSGDPAIYGAIQEQMTAFDERGMDYFIVPGISAFQAAAASLNSEFTIPEVVQTIILTRGAGNTPLPPHEDLAAMAQHRATMCIFLSATIAKRVQAQLEEHYPPDTPVAILYRVTWDDEEIYTGQLADLAALIREHKLTRTVLIVVGAAIGARKNRSQLYHPDWKHIFRTGKPAKVKKVK
ncbi:MAG: precorrin-4 C(11)-methyltransferase [Cytophagaceae bacterium]|nr:MAG: precorrin-4 C(11)-methyltransferase [Cytophagaceae bacterium]